MYITHNWIGGDNWSSKFGFASDWKWSSEEEEPATEDKPPNLVNSSCLTRLLARNLEPRPLLRFIWSSREISIVDLIYHTSNSHTYIHISLLNALFGSRGKKKKKNRSKERKQHDSFIKFEFSRRFHFTFRKTKQHQVKTYFPFSFAFSFIFSANKQNINQRIWIFLN